MNIIDFLKKLAAGLAIVCTLAGTAIALMASYSENYDVMLIGFLFILLGALIMEFLNRKFGTF